MNPKLTICIPTYEQNGTGVDHLGKLIETCMNQKISFDCDILVSDNSQDNEISDFVESLKSISHIPMKYIRNEVRGISQNSNNLLDHATGDFIKLMYQDDYFLQDDALETFYEMLQAVPWCISDSYHVDAEGTQKNRVQARYTDKLLSGLNTIGMPSVTAFRKTAVRFDVNLKTALDSFFYYNLWQEYGLPGRITLPLIAQRIHKNSASAKIKYNPQAEMMYMRRKVNEAFIRKDIPSRSTGPVITGKKTYDVLLNTPSDINEHFPLLKEISMQCETVTEFGVRNVISTYALIEGTPKKIYCYDIKATNQIEAARTYAKEYGVEIKYVVVDVLKLAIQPTDFLFIDTLHNYFQLVQELSLHAAQVKKFIGFHDVTTFGLTDEVGTGTGITGLLPAILEFLQLNPEWSVYRYHHFNNGMLILKRNSVN